jgi:hypothetical protein
MLLNKSKHLVRLHQPRRMSSLHLLRLDSRALRPRFLHHQLLHKQGDGPIVFTKQVRAGILQIRRTGRRRDLGRPRMRTQRLGPFLAIRGIVEEERVRVMRRHSAIRFLFLVSRGLFHATLVRTERYIHRGYTNPAPSPQTPGASSGQRPG